MGIRRTYLVAGLSLVAALTAATALAAGWGVHRAGAQSTPTVALDMDPTNGSGPCDPVDNVRAIVTGDEFQVAVCLTNGRPPGGFQLYIKYDDELNQCVPAPDCAGTACLDGNPDANVGSTTFGSSNLGTSWDCNIMQVQPPTCDRDPGSGKGHGEAFLQCNTVVGESLLAAGEGVSAPIAMVSFKSIADGTDTMTFADVEIDDDQVTVIVDQIVGPGAFVGGSISTEGVPPTLTPGPTATIAPIATTSPIEAAVTASAVQTAIAQGTPAAAFTAAANATTTAANTTPAAGATSGAKTTPTAKATAKPSGATAGEEDDGSSGPNAAVIAIIVVAGVVVVGGAGFFGYRRFFGR